MRKEDVYRMSHNGHDFDLTPTGFVDRQDQTHLGKYLPRIKPRRPQSLPDNHVVSGQYTNSIS